MQMRSLKLSPTGKQSVERALTGKAWSTEDLAYEAGVGRATATKFRSSTQKIDRKNFVKLCEKLGLDWATVADLSNQLVIQPFEPKLTEHSTYQNLDTLIQQVRGHCRQKILDQHSRVLLLNGVEIGVDQLYVDVWLLDRPEHKLYKSHEALLKAFDVKSDRLALSKRIGKRSLGFDLANTNSRLVILGKPGSGKTTFLKQLAIDWCEKKFQFDSIAVVIELRQIRRDKKWYLLDVIDKELGLDNWKQVEELLEELSKLVREQKEKKNEVSLLEKEKYQSKKRIMELQQIIEELQIKEKYINEQINVSRQQVKAILEGGKLLLLMDGLDEVPVGELRQIVQEEICLVAKNYPKNRYILTCRTQIIESIPAGFTCVEVADFSEEQTKQFVHNWFIKSGKPGEVVAQQWETFKRAISKNPPLKEMTATPVLLSLICLVLEDSGEMPSQITWLYKKGIKLLLSKWNATKQIDDWEVGNKIYQGLSVKQKEKLLTKIAAQKFNDPRNYLLFEQEEILGQITKFLELNDQNEGLSVLKAIESQHGLLIERADELWSYSHLTFQEYFTVQWLIKLSPEKLAKKIKNQRWQEVVEQVVKSQQPADLLLTCIKRAIDKSISGELILQNILLRVFQKSATTQKLDKLMVIQGNDFGLDTLDYALSLAEKFEHDLKHAISSDIEAAFIRGVGGSPHLYTSALNCATDLHQTLDKFRGSFIYKTGSKLADKLEKCIRILHKLPAKNTRKAQEGDLEVWWNEHGRSWIEQCGQVRIEYCNIGFDKLSSNQKKELQEYYDLNKFIVNLIRLDGAVSRSVYAEIESTLLLPWKELQHRFPETYGQTQSISKESE